MTVTALHPGTADPVRDHHEPAATPEGGESFTARLHRDLARIDVEGWDGPTGRALLLELRRGLIAPVIAAAPRLGSACAQADASAWQEVWQVLTSAWIRTASNPRAVLWTVAVRAVNAEMITTTMQTSRRKAWRWRARAAATGTSVAGAERYAVPLSLDVMKQHGFEPTLAAVGPDATKLGRRLELIVDALVAVGWKRNVACEVLIELADAARRNPLTGTATDGWRLVTVRTGVPGWQVRRVQRLVCGGNGQRGVLQRIVEGGATELQCPDVQAALWSTTRRRWPSPQKALTSGDVPHTAAHDGSGLAPAS